ncbi:hypothetical protein LINPERHAP1_LOCUS23139, partial [Linum perenne]
MSLSVLSTMSFDKSDAELHLRLLNTWKVGNPSRPDQFYAFRTLWVDAEGTEIEGTSHRTFADILEDQIVVGSVYELARCPLQMPRKAFRTCSYPRMLAVAPSNVACVICSPPPSFPLMAFEYVSLKTYQVEKVHVLIYQETRYRCKAIIVDIDTVQHWHYRGCKECYRSVAMNDDKYWCAVHHDLTETETQPCYRIKLFVEDHSGLANFILLGRSADQILPISVAQLARAYPNEDGTFPPPIESLRQATATFEVRLARNSRPNVFGEFQVSRVWDLQHSPTVTKLPPLVSLSVSC